MQSSWASKTTSQQMRQPAGKAMRRPAVAATSRPTEKPRSQRASGNPLYKGEIPCEGKS